jgi:uncharacterized protein Usg
MTEIWQEYDLHFVLFARIVEKVVHIVTYWPYKSMPNNTHSTMKTHNRLYLSPHKFHIQIADMIP